MSLARTKSLSLAFTQQAAISCTLQKAHSIPFEEWVQPAAERRKVKKGYHLVVLSTDAKQGRRASTRSAGDSYELEEQQTVSKDLMQSLSRSLRLDQFPDQFPHESYDIREENLNIIPDQNGKESLQHYVYILDCRTGRSVCNHMELRNAMNALRHWSIQAPGNCCLTYRHDDGDIVSLPWPDLEAGAPEEVEVFVSAINHVEKRNVFSTCYKRSPYVPTRRMRSIPAPTLSVNLTLTRNSVA